MKILYLVHQFYPKNYTGTEKFVLHLSTMMQLFGHTVKIVTFELHNGEFNNKRGKLWLNDYLYRSLPVLSFRCKHLDPDRDFLVENETVRKFSQQIISDEKPDIIHAAHIHRISEFVNSARALGVPYLITLTDFYLLCPNAKLITAAGNLCLGPNNGDECLGQCPHYKHQMIVDRLRLAQKYLYHTKKVIAPSNFLGNIFLREYPNLNVSVIPYGMQYRNIRRNTKTYPHNQHLVIGYAGSLNHHKGVHVLIDAFKSIKNEGVQLYIYGSFGLEAELRDQAKRDHRVRFCGVFSEDQISEFFTSIDLLVVPSLWHENNTIVMREALSHHVPVVVSDVGGMTETIKDGVNGFTFQVGSSEDLKNVLEKIIETPEVLNRIKGNIQYDLPITIEQEAYLYEREYRRILQSERENHEDTPDK